jgi:hypothetical protein
MVVTRSKKAALSDITNQAQAEIAAPVKSVEAAGTADGQLVSQRSCRKAKVPARVV